MPESPVTLTAESPAAVPVLAMGTGLPPTKDGQPCYYRRRPVAYARGYDLTHPGTRETFKLSQAMLDKAVDTARRRAAKGILPFLTPYHVDHRKEPDARDTLGYAVGLSRDGDDLVADLQLIGDDAITVSARNRVSIYMLPDGVDADGEHYENVIHHIAFSPNEALHGMGDQVPLAASGAGLPPLEVRAYSLCATQTKSQTPADAGRIEAMPLTAEQKARLAKLTAEKDIPAEPDAEFYIKLAESRVPADPKVAEQVTALSARVTAAEKERDDAKALALSAAPRNPDPVTLAMYADNIAAKRESAVRSGAVSEAQAAMFDQLIKDSAGNPTPLALSASVGNRPLAFALWDTVGKLAEGTPIRTGNAVERVPVRIPPLSGAGNGAFDLDEEIKAAYAYRDAQLAARGHQPVGAAAK